MSTKLVPGISYRMVISSDLKECSATISATERNAYVILGSMRGYYVDVINYLEDMGVDREEIRLAVETMELFAHNTALFGCEGTFLISDVLEGV
jgi:hypothetical protein